MDSLTIIFLFILLVALVIFLAVTYLIISKLRISTKIINKNSKEIAIIQTDLNLTLRPLEEKLSLNTKEVHELVKTINVLALSAKNDNREILLTAATAHRATIKTIEIAGQKAADIQNGIDTNTANIKLNKKAIDRIIKQSGYTI